MMSLERAVIGLLVLRCTRDVYYQHCFIQYPYNFFLHVPYPTSSIHRFSLGILQ